MPRPSIHPVGRPRWLLPFATLAFLCAPGLTFAQGLEYRVKAAFLFNFAKFAEWPDSAGLPNAELTIAVWAPDEPYRAIAAALVDKTVGRRKIVVTRFDPAAPPPQILFIHENSEPVPDDLLQQLFDSHVLAVGESPGFAARYGIIGLVPRGDSLRFQVNITAAERAGLRLSGQLARLAEIVKDSR